MKVFKKIFFGVFMLWLAAGAVESFAQAVYTPYPINIEGQSVYEPAPEVVPDGYKAVYVSHFGRHGSRYLLKKEESASYKVLSGSLQGELGQAIEHFHSLHIGKHGKLSGLGAQEQRSIGRRLAKRLPELFAFNAGVSAKSSFIDRCKASMQNFLEGLKSESPMVNAKTSSSLFTYRMLSKGVKHGKYKPKSKAILALARYAADADCIGEDKDLIYRYFGMKDKLEMWEELEACFNNNLRPKSLADAHVARKLLKDIVSKADAALASGKKVADFRFGHDSAFVPLGVLMGLSSFSEGCTIGDIVPMAANLQLIFYRNDAGNIIVKILHNEKVTSIPDLKPTETINSSHYYSWPELRSFLLNR